MKIDNLSNQELQKLYAKDHKMTKPEINLVATKVIR